MIRTGIPVWTRPPAEPPPLEGHHDVDVVVVGAGIAGTACALELGSRGVKVLLVDRARPGDNVTGRSNAKITALHQARYHQIAERHGRAAATTYADAQQAAIAWLREHGGDVLQMRRAGTIARDPDEESVLRLEAEATGRAGLHTTLGDAEAFPGATAALWLDDQAQVDPVRLLAVLHRGMPSNVRLVTGVVAGIRERPGRLTVRGDGFTVGADDVVLATGLPILDRGAFFALVEPQVSYLVALEHADAPAEGPMLITAGEPKRSVRWAEIDGRSVILVGGEGHRAGAGDATASVDALEAWARQSYLGIGLRLGAWSARDFVSADLLPLAGPQWRLGGRVHVITGLSKWGFTSGVACARAVADRLTGKPLDAFAELVTTARTPDRGALGDLVRSQAAVGKHMVGGWARGLLSSAGAPSRDNGDVGRSGGWPLGVCRTPDGDHGVLPICPHLGGVVSYNPVDERWDCPLHGSLFHADGEVASGPAVRALRSREAAAPDSSSA